MARSLSLGTSNDNQLFKLAARTLGSIYKNRANLHLVGVALSGFQVSLAEQGDLYAQGELDRSEKLFSRLDAIRNRYGHSAVVAGPSVSLLGKLSRDSYGFVLRTPSLTK